MVECTTVLKAGQLPSSLYQRGALEIQALCDTGQTIVWTGYQVGELPKVTGGERRADPDDVPPGTRSVADTYAGGTPSARRGCPLDALDANGQLIGSRLWLLDDAKQTEETRQDAIAYAAEGIAWITALGVTTATATLGSGNTVSVPVQCEVGGTVGNQPAGVVLTIVSPVIGLQNQTVTVDTGGIAGGADAEALSAWRARILLRIQKRGKAGCSADYIEWAEANGAAPTPNVLPAWVGLGSVGVAFAMPNPNGVDRLVPSGPQVTAMQAALDLVRPVTAQVIALAAVQTLVPLTMALATDTVVNRANATQAAQAYIAGVAIGGLLDHSELADAVLQATGTQMLAIGTVTWVRYS